MVAAADGFAEALDLAFLNHGRDGLDLDLEHQFNGRLDLGLGRIAQHLEQHLVVLLGRHRGFFTHDRGDKHLGQAVSGVLRADHLARV